MAAARIFFPKGGRTHLLGELFGDLLRIAVLLAIGEEHQARFLDGLGEDGRVKQDGGGDGNACVQVGGVFGEASTKVDEKQLFLRECN